MDILTTERGWAGHFIAANSCYFRRNTLIEYGDQRIVVSTVGNCVFHNEIIEIGAERFYETMAFNAQFDGTYWDANVSEEVPFESPWSINAKKASQLPKDVDNVANDMHDTVVKELCERLKSGVVFDR